MPTPVSIVASGGIPIVNTPLGAPMTPVEAPLYAVPVTIVDPPLTGIPVHLVNEDMSDWLPAYDLLADFENSIFYWGGQSRTLANLTANGDGSYDLTYNGYWNGGTTAVVDYSYPDDYASVPSGTMFTITDGSSRHAEFFVYNISATSKLLRNLVQGPTFVNPKMSHPSDAGSVDGHGRHRGIMVVQPGQKARTLVDNFIQTIDGGVNISALATPTKVTFKRNGRFNNDPLTNATLHRVAIYRGALSQGALDIIARDGIKSPVHFLGDSFLNLSYLKEEVMKLTKAAGYIGYSQDGVGGSTITEEAARFATPYTKWWKSTLVIMDGGFDGTLAEATAAIDSMRALINASGHDRFLYVQSNPQVGNSTGALRTAWNDKDAGVLAYIGAGHYCATLAGMQGFSSGDAGDIANVADGLWPATLMSDTIHPNPAIESPNTISGTAALGGIIKARLAALGWL